MWHKINLRTRIYVILSTLVLITMSGGIVMVWYTFRMQNLMTFVIEKNVAASQAAEELEIALVNQRGFVSYYFLDGDVEWLRRLAEYRQVFKKRLNQARSYADTVLKKEAINRIESEYHCYINTKDQVIAYYKAGERQLGANLHHDVRNHFFKILELSEDYKKIHTEQIRRARDESHTQAEKLRLIAGTAVLAAFFLGLLLAFVLVYQVLGPVRRLAFKVNPRASDKYRAVNEVKALSLGVRGLIEDIDHSQLKLEKSQEVLLQAEKMSLVGKIAAGTAHTIRNPLTSVKMRLFSLARTLDLTNAQKDDFSVISNEINRIDTIVENFLEFSRPPKLKMQLIRTEDVVDVAIQLLRHRLDSYGVNIKLNRSGPVSEIMGDPDQLKEVLVNIVVNACEAMENGGSIVISEDESDIDSLGRAAVIQLTDNGPGIPEHIQKKIFQPFFTTKEEGTGLGLSIAARIMEQHGGSIYFTSKEGEGTTFVIAMPIKETELEHHPDR